MKRVNARRVKIHRSYAVDEAARLLDVHKNTVRSWIKSGLPTVDERRPILILGRSLSNFLRNRRTRRRQPCQPDQLYCFRCQAPKRPTGLVAEYIPITPTSGNLRATCEDCSTVMYRKVRWSKLSISAAGIDVTLPEAERHISDCTFPCLNCAPDTET